MAAKVFENNAVALGFFDSVHIGHRKIISLAADYAKIKGLGCKVVTFTQDIKDGKSVFTLSERTEIINGLGAETIAFNFDKIKNLDKKDFIRLLISGYGAKAFFCGFDYTFGKGAEGNADYLLSQSAVIGVPVFVEKEITYKGEKVSTSLIKDCISLGEMEKASYLLGGNYFIKSKIVSGYGRGHLLGFPTANSRAEVNKLLPLSGVYATATEFENKIYKSVTSVGAKPTFSDDIPTIETFIKNYDGDLYGKTIKVSFVKRLRDIIKYDSVDKLTAQIKEDAAWQ